MNNQAYIGISLAIGAVAQALSQVLSQSDATLQAWIWLLASYPTMIVASGILGYLAPLRPVTWACLIVAGDFLVGMLTTSNLNMLPIGIVLYLVLAIPCIASAWIAAFVRRRRDGSRRVDTATH